MTFRAADEMKGSAILQVPLFVAFEISDVDWSWGCIIDFCAGALPNDVIYDCYPYPAPWLMLEAACPPHPRHLHLQC